MGRFILWFIVGMVLMLSFLGSLAPKPEHTWVPLSSMPAATFRAVCGWGDPVSAYRIQQESSYSLYEIHCSSGLVVTESW